VSVCVLGTQVSCAEKAETINCKGKNVNVKLLLTEIEKVVLDNASTMQFTGKVADSGNICRFRGM